MSGKIGLLTGSFDPITKGHVDMVERSLDLFDQVYIGIFSNPKKHNRFTGQERLRMVESVFEEEAKVRVFLAENRLVVDVARELGVTHLIRGLRNGIDLEYEANFDYFNRQLAPEVETVYLLAKPELRMISSSQVRELLDYHQDIRAYVPSRVVKEIEKYEKT